MATKAFDTELKGPVIPSEHEEHPRAGVGGLTAEEEEFLAAVSPEEANKIYHKARCPYGCG